MFNIVGPFLSLYYYDNWEDNLEFKANIEVSFLIAGIYSLCLNLLYVKQDVFLIKAIGLSAIRAIFAGIRPVVVFNVHGILVIIGGAIFGLAVYWFWPVKVKEILGEKEKNNDLS